MVKVRVRNLRYTYYNNFKTAQRLMESALTRIYGSHLSSFDNCEIVEGVNFGEYGPIEYEDIIIRDEGTDATQISRRKFHLRVVYDGLFIHEGVPDRIYVCCWLFGEDDTGEVELPYYHWVDVTYQEKVWYFEEILDPTDSGNLILRPRLL